MTRTLPDDEMCCPDCSGVGLIGDRQCPRCLGFATVPKRTGRR